MAFHRFSFLFFRFGFFVFFHFVFSFFFPLGFRFILLSRQYFVFYRSRLSSFIVAFVVFFASCFIVLVSVTNFVFFSLQCRAHVATSGPNAIAMHIYIDYQARKYEETKRKSEKYVSCIQTLIQIEVRFNQRAGVTDWNYRAVPRNQLYHWGTNIDKLCVHTYHLKANSSLCYVCGTQKFIYLIYLTKAHHIANGLW